MYSLRTRNAQGDHNYRLNRTAEEQLLENIIMRNHVANTHADENREHSDKRLRANVLKQKEASKSHRCTQSTTSHINMYIISLSCIRI